MFCIRHYFFLAALAASPVLADSPHLDAELSLKRDNNVSRAEDARDIRADNILALDVSASRSLMLSPNSGLLLRAMAGLAEFQHYDDISHVDLGISAVYRIQPVKAYTAPWFEAGIGVQRQNFLGSDIRDGNVLTLDFGVGKRVTDALRVRAGAGWERRFADDNEVFDWQRLKAFVAADVKFSTSTTLYTNFSRTYGDQVFTATPTLVFRDAAKAIINDPAFGARRAYRLNAVADVLELGSSFSLGSKKTLDIGLRYFQIDASGDHAYDGAELRVSWLYRWQ